MTVVVLTTIIGETAREIAASSSRREASALADAAVTLIRRLDPTFPQPRTLTPRHLVFLDPGWVSAHREAR